MCAEKDFNLPNLPIVPAGDGEEILTTATWQFESLFMDNQYKALYGYGDSDKDKNDSCQLVRRTAFIAKDKEGHSLKGVVAITIGFRLNGSLPINDDNPEVVQIGLRVFLDNSNDFIKDWRYNIDVKRMNETQWVNTITTIECRSISIEITHYTGRGFELEYLGFEPK